MTNFYPTLCQRKIRKINDRIKLCEKHLDPTKEKKEMIERNEIRIQKKRALLKVWENRLKVAQEEAKKIAEMREKDAVVDEVDEKQIA